MPPLLALALTVIFILFLLRLDHQQNPKASFVLWIPTLWMLLIAGKALGVWTGTGAGMEEGSVLDRNVISVLLVIGLLILIKRHFNWAEGLKNNWAAILLAGFMLVGILWSDIPFTALKRWIREMLVAIIMAFVVSTEIEPRQALMSLFRRIIYIHVPLSPMLIKYYPYLGVQYARWSGEYMWIGVATQKNGLALLCTFAIFFLIWSFIRHRKGLDASTVWYQPYINIFIVMLSVWLFMGPNHVPTYSSTSLIALMLGLMTLFAFLWFNPRNMISGRSLLLPILIVFIILYGTYTPFAGGLSGIDISSLVERDQTLTGRTEVWNRLIPFAVQKPILGYGYSSFWNDELRASIDATAHNGYLDIILNMGAAGLIFWSIFLVVSCRKAQAEMIRNPYWGFFWFCIILMAVVHNIAESSMTSFVNLMPVIVLFLSVSLQTPASMAHRSSA